MPNQSFRRNVRVNAIFKRKGRKCVIGRGKLLVLGRKKCQSSVLPTTAQKPLLHFFVIYTSVTLNLQLKLLVNSDIRAFKDAVTNLSFLIQMCGPLWGQQCGNQDFYPGICAKLNPLFQPQAAFSPAVQSKICVLRYFETTSLLIFLLLAAWKLENVYKYVQKMFRDVALPLFKRLLS